MSASPQKAQLDFTLDFPDWAEVLEAAPLPGRARESYAITIRWYLSWCRRARVAVDTVSVRQFIAWAEEEKRPQPWQLEGWKEALRWLFRSGRRRGLARAPAAEAGSIRPTAGQVGPTPASEAPAAGWEMTWVEWVKSTRRLARIRHLSYRTERTYLDWIGRFVRRQGERPPAQAREPELRAFLDELAQAGRVSASTQRQALNALVFLFREVMGRSLGDFSDYQRARARAHLPVVLTRKEVGQLFGHLEGTTRLMARLMYGTGLRLMELIRLRVKDVDFGRGLILVRGGKGDKDRVTMLPEGVRADLDAHVERLRGLHAGDQAVGIGPVWLPEALGRKYPKAGQEWGWQWLWPSRELSVDPRGGVKRRHHVQEGAFQAAVRQAAQARS
jgi:integron integrase